MKQILALSKVHVATLFIACLLIIIYLEQEYIAIPQISNMSVVDETVKTKILEGYYKFRWLMFLAPVVILLIRVSLVALCLFLGSLFNDQQKKIKYTEGWNIALKSDVVLILFSVAVCAAAVVAGSDAATEFSRHSSFAFLVDSNITDQWLLVPIAALNIFEICYWFFMAKLVAVQTGDSYWSSFKFVLSTYSVGYLFYIVFLMFLLLYLTN
ncbi:hypothetical protein [Alistipes timonensis]